MQGNISFIVPVYNRPEEIQELLDSFLGLDSRHVFEIVIVEDGSTIPCRQVVETYKNRLNISYYFKENSGPGDSRNFGMQKAKGDYFIILDSDCLLPSHYLKTVETHLASHYTDCFGGADAAHPSFTPLQKAINYVMTSFFTTGGIRGNKKSIQKFEPRSFNMGLSRKAFRATGGFSDIHPGEDPDLSQRVLKMGFKSQFIPNAYVFHKRRVSWKKFYVQVKKFGLVRPILNTWHPSSSKITFWFPSLFILFVIASLVLATTVSFHCLFPLLLYVCIIFVDSSIKNKSLWIGGLSVIAMFVQFFGYGWAFAQSTFHIQFLRKNPRQQYPKLFFKYF